MKKFTFFLFFTIVSLLCILPLFSEPKIDYSGTSSADLRGNIKNDEIEIMGTVRFTINWHLWRLMGEPVEEYNATWAIEEDAKVYNVSFLRNSKYVNYYFKEIPKYVLEKIRIYDMRLWGAPWQPRLTSGVDRSGSIGLVIDPGVMSRPAIINSIYYDDTRGPESYNTPGSPRWSKLFVTDYELRDGRVEETEYLSAEEAREIMKNGISFIGRENNASEMYVIYCKFDLSAVKEWLLQLEKEAISAERRKVIARERALNEKEAEREEQRKKEEEEDFWGTPDDSTTYADSVERYEIDEEKKELQQAESKNLRLQQDARNERLRIDRIVFEHKEEIANRPEPGSRFRGELVKKYQLFEEFQDQLFVHPNKHTDLDYDRIKAISDYRSYNNIIKFSPDYRFFAILQKKKWGNLTIVETSTYEVVFSGLTYNCNPNYTNYGEDEGCPKFSANSMYFIFTEHGKFADGRQDKTLHVVTLNTGQLHSNYLGDNQSITGLFATNEHVGIWHNYRHTSNVIIFDIESLKKERTIEIRSNAIRSISSGKSSIVLNSIPNKDNVERIYHFHPDYENALVIKEYKDLYTWNLNYYPNEVSPNGEYCLSKTQTHKLGGTGIIIYHYDIIEIDSGKIIFSFCSSDGLNFVGWHEDGVGLFLKDSHSGKYLYYR